MPKDAWIKTWNLTNIVIEKEKKREKLILESKQ